MVNKIIELLPSNGLKAEIRRTDYKFTDGQLLQIIFKYAPTFDERISLMADFAKQAEKNIAELATLFINDQKEILKKFKENDGSFVYELNIKDSPNAAWEKYLCASFEAALRCIDGYYEYYSFVNAQETEQTIYKIEKRKIFDINSKFSEDYYGECILRAKKVIVSVSIDRAFNDCGEYDDCENCDRICPNRQDRLMFPCFVKHLDIVRYKATYNNNGFGAKEHFAVCLSPENYCIDECDLYVIDLDSYAITQRKFGEIHNCHWHPKITLSEVVSPESLDKEMRENYLAFVEYFKSHDIL